MKQTLFDAGDGSIRLGVPEEVVEDVAVAVFVFTGYNVLRAPPLLILTLFCCSQVWKCVGAFPLILGMSFEDWECE